MKLIRFEHSCIKIISISFVSNTAGTSNNTIDNMQSTVTASLMQLGLMLWRRRGKIKKKVAEDGKSINLPQGQNSLLSLNLREKKFVSESFSNFSTTC